MLASYRPNARYPTPDKYSMRSAPVRDKSLGYLYFMDRNHPLADKKGRVLHHRHVASLKLGRWLQPNEVAHHIDENRSHNDAENLEVKTRSRHAIEHAIERGHNELAEKLCDTCGLAFMPHSIESKYCSAKCFGASRAKAGWPSDIELKEWLECVPATYVAKCLGVSSSAVKKRCRSRNIPTHSRGFWSSK